MPPEGFGISARNITVSTVGVVPGIRKLTAEGIPVRLAVSLHAPSDALRDELVPMNKRFNTTQVLDAAHDYFLSSKRRVSIEYALMRGINDQAEHARLLAKRLNHYGDDWAHSHCCRPRISNRRGRGLPVPCSGTPRHCCNGRTLPLVSVQQPSLIREQSCRWPSESFHA